MSVDAMRLRGGEDNNRKVSLHFIEAPQKQKSFNFITGYFKLTVL